MTKKYLFTLGGLIEPGPVTGPYGTEMERSVEARAQHREMGDNDGGPFWLDVSDDGAPRMGAYSGGFFAGGEDDR